MKRPFKDKRILGPLVELNSARGSDREFYQERFTQRMVSASKQGVGDPIEEIEYFEDTIEGVPWSKFNDEERVSIATPAIDSIRTVFQISAEQGQISDDKVVSIVSKFSMILFERVAGIEDESLASSGLGIIKLDIEEDI